MAKRVLRRTRSTISSAQSWYSVCNVSRQPARSPRRNSVSYPPGSFSYSARKDFRRDSPCATSLSIVSAFCIRCMVVIPLLGRLKLYLPVFAGIILTLRHRSRQKRDKTSAPVRARYGIKQVLQLHDYCICLCLTGAFTWPSASIRNLLYRYVRKHVRQRRSGFQRVLLAAS